MNKLLTFFAFNALCLAGLLSTGWGEEKHWNQKVTIEVETPNGIVSHSSVLTYKQAQFPKRYTSPSSKTLGLFGEAPFIELKPKQYIFALSLYAPHAILKEYARFYEVKPHDKNLINLITSDKTRPEIVSFEKPAFFYFLNHDEPSSIKNQSHNTLHWNFGHGVKFRSIKYQITDEPRTKGKIAEILPWLETHRGAFNPVAAKTNPEKPNIPGFNRSILSRHYSCTVSPFLMNNLTYGFYRNGLNCSF